jgi:hypothetical protein
MQSNDRYSAVSHKEFLSMCSWHLTFMKTEVVIITMCGTEN